MEEVIDWYTPEIQLAIRAHVSRMHCVDPALSRADLYQEACLRLCKANTNYDPARQVSWKAFAERHIRGAILDALRGKGKRQPQWTEYRRQYIREMRRYMRQNALSDETRSTVLHQYRHAEILEVLRPLEQTIFEGICTGKTRKEIAEQFHVHPSRISHILAKMYMKIRNASV